MKAIIPAAGYGTRMYPLTLSKPKALLEVRGRPLIEYLIEKIAGIEEVNEIIVVTNDRFHSQFIQWSASFRKSLPLTILNNHTSSPQQRLGTIGDIFFALQKKEVDEDFLVVHGDNFFSFDLKPAHAYFKEKKSSVLGMHDVGDYATARRMGNPRMDEEQRIIWFREKDPFPSSTLCTLGIYFFPRKIIPLIEQYLHERNPPDRTGNFIKWLYSREEIFGYVFQGEWFDLGSLETYGALA
jgi:glucose-1-phosphate thymidylyltransferase